MATHEVQILLTIRLEAPDGVTVSLDTPGVASDTSATDANVFEGVSRAVRPFVESFARAAAPHGIRLVRPQGDRQDYRNVVAPGMGMRSRLGAVSVVTGRLAIDKLPELAAEEPAADVFFNKGKPVGTKVYLNSEDRVAAGVRLCTRAIQVRGDVRASHV